MLVILIGKHGVDYYTVKKKDENKHFFTVKGQLYKIYPDALTPIDIYQNGAWIGSDSCIVFEENGTKPYHCKYPKDYEMDAILSSMDEHKIMSPRRKSWLTMLTGSGGGLKTLLEFMPWIVIGFILLFTVVLK